MVAAAVPLIGAGIALAPIAEAIRALYGMAIGVDEWFNKHIAEMKGSENPTVSRSGRVLEMAKLGFGIGYITPVVVISAGQLLLGNTFSAAGTVATAATLTNPIALTCAAIGAIYYGWNALSDAEREAMLKELSQGLELGFELIKSILRFVIETTKDLLSSRNFDDLKAYITSAAAVFGKTLSDVTHELSDRISGAIDAIRKKSGDALDSTAVLASETYGTVKETAGKAVDGARGALGSAKSPQGRKKATGRVRKEVT